LVFLVERHKWGQGKYLLFDIDQILGRKQADALKATAALLSRDALCPDDGSVLHDTLDDRPPCLLSSTTAAWASGPS
jgi:hypothetical protein